MCSREREEREGDPGCDTGVVRRSEAGASSGGGERRGNTGVERGEPEPPKPGYQSMSTLSAGPNVHGLFFLSRWLRATEGKISVCTYCTKIQKVQGRVFLK